MAADKVLVTGASGFVGSAVAHALVRSGYRVRALLRQASSRKNLGGLDLEIAEGDMRDPLVVARAMQACVFCSMLPPTTAFGRANRKKFCTTTKKGPGF